MERCCDRPTPAVAFVTLGCAKNEVDTREMADRLRGAGFAIAEDPESAQAIVVNTCAFIQSAIEESLDTIFDLVDLPNVAAGAPLVVAGCLPSRFGDELARELTETRLFVPCNGEDDIAEVIESALNWKAMKPEPQDFVGGCRRELAEPTGLPFAYVKISDGCDRRCSYCTIPDIRGSYRSFAPDAVARDVRRQIARGAREIVLIAQDTGCYGRDLKPRTSLAQLLDELACAHPQTWFRVLYTEPDGITDELLVVVAAHDNVCPYFDIPLQHVDATILRAMRRRGSAVEFRDLVARIRRTVPDATLRTTLIAGFPGEGEEQFRALCDFVDEGLFDYVGVFAYSAEEGTPAATLGGQLDEGEKLERAQILRDTADAVCTAKVAGRIGTACRVLVEGREEDGQLYGRAMCQAPEVDGVVYLESGEVGEFADVRIADALLYEMEGE